MFEASCNVQLGGSTASCRSQVCPFFYTSEDEDGGVLRENPFYTPPTKFLRKFAARPSSV